MHACSSPALLACPQRMDLTGKLLKGKKGGYAKERRKKEEAMIKPNQSRAILEERRTDIYLTRNIKRKSRLYSIIIDL
jgi:hypothetical protein